MNKTAVILLGLILPLLMGAALRPRIDRGTSSVSGQFVVFAPTNGVPSEFHTFATNSTFMVLDERLLPVSCERIKSALWRELGVSGPWRGKIYLQVYQPATLDDPITMVREQFRDGWSYRLYLPQVLERDRFGAALMHVLLVELANRNATRGHSAEIPTWLAEGLARELLTVAESEFLLPLPVQSENGFNVARVNIDDRRKNPLAKARQVLGSRAALTFEQLSWPAPQDLTGESGEIYRCSAQLLVHQLMRINNGSRRFRTMITELPNRYNWQFAFFDAFSPILPSALETEKWWALQVAQFTARDLTHAWTLEESWRRLDGIVFSQVDVRARPSELPLNSRVPLQSIVREWNALQQSQVLLRKQRELDMLRSRAAPGIIDLVDDYREAVGVYMQRRRFTSPIIPVKEIGNLSDRTALEFIARLDALEIRRQELRPADPTSPAIAGADVAPLRP